MMLINFLLLSLFTSCAHRAYNQIVEGHIKMTSGVYKDKQWIESWEFKRISWYHGANVAFELVISPLDANSPYRNWLELDSQAVASCKSLLISFQYSVGPQKISYALVNEQMKSNGYNEVVLTNFFTQLRMHPDMEQMRLKMYQLKAYCNNSNDIKNELNIFLPGYQTKIIKVL